MSVTATVTPELPVVASQAPGALIFSRPQSVLKKGSFGVEAAPDDRVGLGVGHPGVALQLQHGLAHRLARLGLDQLQSRHAGLLLQRDVVVGAGVSAVGAAHSALEANQQLARDGLGRGLGRGRQTQEGQACSGHRDAWHRVIHRKSGRKT